MRGGSSGQLPVSGQLCPPQHHPGHRRASSLGSQQLVQQMSPGDSSSGFPGGAAAEDPIRLATGQCKEIIRLGSNVVSRQVDPHSGMSAKSTFFRVCFCPMQAHADKGLFRIKRFQVSEFHFPLLDFGSINIELMWVRDFA